jgi:DNA topoisomerase I
VWHRGCNAVATVSERAPATSAREEVRRLSALEAHGPALALAGHPGRAAKAAGLTYVSEQAAGIRRVRSGKGFRYVGPTGAAVRDPETLARIRSLVIPPAWNDVWICMDPVGHVQATGRDARGRKQYRYHPHWRKIRDEAKYGRAVAFATVLPALRARVSADLRRRGLPRDKVIAAVVRLLEATLIRVGNEEYARANRSFGLTTLRSRHAAAGGRWIRFRFRGKSGKEHLVRVRDPRLGRIVRGCQALRGPLLFQYRNGSGAARPVTSDDVNRYLREATGREFTAKDFRTWAATVRTAWELHGLPPAVSQAAGRRNVARAMAAVAERLGNTPAICRQSYVHPAVLGAYLEGTLSERLHARATGAVRAADLGLRPKEVAVLAILSRPALAAAAGPEIA